jgi:hypothetical protein
VIPRGLTVTTSKPQWTILYLLIAALSYGLPSLTKLKFAKSSCEAEYIALSKAYQIPLQIQNMINEFLPNFNIKIKIYAGNEDVKGILKSDALKKRTRHIILLIAMFKMNYKEKIVRLSPLLQQQS